MGKGKEGLFSYFFNNLSNVNDSKYFAGLMMLILNIGGKYVTVSLSKNQEMYLKSFIFRQFFIFTVVWIATREIVTSIILTTAFITLTNYLFNEESKLCILPKRFKALASAIDTNNDDVISDEELENAIQMIQKVKRNSKSNLM
jgi:hypothetical protein